MRRRWGREQRRSCGALAVAVLASALAGCAPMTTVREHPDFAERRAKLSKLAVMPPDVAAVLIVFQGDDEPLPGEVAAVAKRLPELLEMQLGARRGFEVVPVEVDEKTSDPELRLALTQAQQTFSQVSSEMYSGAAVKTQDQALHHRASLGPQIADLADRLGVDALLFTQYAEFHKSGGQVAADTTRSVLIFAATLGSAVAVSPVYGATLQAALVDGRTGEVLWANVVGRGEMSESPIDALVDELFAPLP